MGALKHQRDARGRMLARLPTPAPLFEKGNSANPGGRNGFYHEAMALARKFAPAAIRRLGELAGLYPDPETGEWVPLDRLDVDPRVVSVACMGIVERALGRPKEYDPAQDPESHATRLADIVSRWSPEQRELARQLFAIDGKMAAEVKAEPAPGPDSGSDGE